MHKTMRVVGFSMTALGLAALLHQILSPQDPGNTLGCLLLLTTGLVGVTGSYKGEARGGRFVNTFVICGGIVMYGTAAVLLTRGGGEGFAVVHLIVGSVFIWSALSRLQWQASPGGRGPAPVGPPPPEDHSVAGWRRRRRIGAMVALALLALHAIYAVLGRYGVRPGLLVSNAQGSLSLIIGAVGLWLLTSPEPGNPQWLRLRRWALRIAIVLAILLNLAAWVAYLATGSFPKETEARTPQIVAVMVVSSLWLCLCSYLRVLAERLRDRALRANMTVLVVISALAVILAAGSLVAGVPQASSRPASATAASADAAYASPTGVLVFWLAVFAWHGWILWRFAHRLK